MNELIQPNTAYFKEYGLIYRILQQLRIIGYKSNTFKGKLRDILILGCVILIYIDQIGIWIKHNNLYKSDLKLSLPYYLGYTSSIITFFMLSFKRDRITKILISTNSPSQQNKCIKTDLLLLLTLLVHLSFVIQPFIHYFMGYNEFMDIYFDATNGNFRYFVAILRVVSSRLLYPLFMNLVSLLFCDLCHQCTVSLAEIKTSIISCPSRGFIDNYQMQVIKKRAQIVNVIQTIQKEFSLILTLMCCSQIFCCFSGFSELLSIITEPSDEGAIIVLYVLNAFLCLTAVIGVAGQIPIEMRNLTDSLHQMLDKKVIESDRPVRPDVMITLTYRPDVTLSASELLFFTRQSALVILGTFLTYSILIRNLII